MLHLTVSALDRIFSKPLSSNAPQQSDALSLPFAEDFETVTERLLQLSA